MNDEMQYMVVIKPTGEILVSVLDRGQVRCSEVEGVAQSLGHVSSVERTDEDDPASIDSTLHPEEGNQ